MNSIVDAAIASRHSDDLIVSECKDGPTWHGGHRRLDYWVLRRSWAKPAMIGYEVKSGRKDFLTDKKWTDYLPLCNELWFVAPKGAIAPEELPETVGLLRLAGSRLVTVRRAVWRDVEPPIALLLYVLMSRAAIKGEFTKQGQEDYWRSWLRSKNDKAELGYQVSKKLRQRYDRDVAAVRSRNTELARENESLAGLKAALKAKGIDWSSWMQPNEVIEQLVVPRWTRSRIRDARKALDELLGDVEVEA